MLVCSIGLTELFNCVATLVFDKISFAISSFVVSKFVSINEWTSKVTDGFITRSVHL